MMELKILTNKQMGEAFGGYDFITDDMRKVCHAQAKLTAGQIFVEIEKQMPDSVRNNSDWWQALENTLTK